MQKLNEHGRYVDIETVEKIVGNFKPALFYACHALSQEWRRKELFRDAHLYLDYLSERLNYFVSDTCGTNPQKTEELRRGINIIKICINLLDRGEIYDT